ncbi:alpha/beta hydrolase family protein [uncultured Croceitalea sp.]|uniref:alpha/beta hydrolase family protein n=1 Tax=uncultured Croceitalea sp. TaxID=1798908 RepID=UPI00374E3437
MKKLFLIFVLLPFLGFGQEIITEENNLKNGEISLPGTLTYPDIGKKLPLVIFIHGSGNVDRNGNQEPMVKANYIAQLADSLNKKNIAFYRYDKRTSNLKNSPYFKNISIHDFVSDVSITIENFKDDKRFKSIHLVGHSQGSLIGMLASDKNIKSYISLAGPGESIDKTLIAQISKQNIEIGEVAKKHIIELKETDTILSLNPFLVQLFAPQNQKFLKSWMLLNPAEEIKKVKKPILIVQGEKDSQVSKNDASILINACAATETDFSSPAQMVLIKNMNHVLKTVQSQEENLKSYTTPDYPLSKELVETIRNFILTHE